MSSAATPGVYTGHASTHKSVCMKDPIYCPKPIVIDGTYARDPLNTTEIRNLRPGVLLGKITATGLWAPSIIGLVTTDYTANATSLIVSVATATEIVRRLGSSGTAKITHAPTDTGTVVPYATLTYSAVTIATGTITCTGIAANIETGAIIGPIDGSAVPKGIVPDGSGVDLFDIRRATTDDIDAYVADMLMGGFIRTAGIVNWPAAANTTLIAWLKAELRKNGCWLAFDDDF